MLQERYHKDSGGFSGHQKKKEVREFIPKMVFAEKHHDHQRQTKRQLPQKKKKKISDMS